MTNEERDLIAKFIARVGGQQQAGGWGSVPASSQQQQLPPVDRDADQFIAQEFQRHPEARYRVTQMAFVQEAALVEAQNRIKRLEWELEQTRNAAQQAVQQQPQQSRGLLGSLFGGGSQPSRGGPFAGYQPTTPPPQPQYPSQYQPGMFQRGGGSGFLGTALAGAAGVAGGMALANLFTGHGSSSAASTVSDSSSGLFGMGSMFGGGGSGSSSSPFDTAGSSNTSDPTAGFADASGGGGGGVDPWASGGATKDFSNSSGGGFWSNEGSTPVSDPGYAPDDSFGGGGGEHDAGWDSSGGGGFDDNA